MTRVMSVDVECVATGPGHNDRAPSWVALVDETGARVFNSFIAVSEVFNYLTPVTGHKPGDLDGARSFDEVMQELKTHLGPDVRLVGQNIGGDIKWLNLQQGVDFQESVDIAQSFKAYNPRYGNYSHFTLRHTANTLLPNEPRHGSHDPEQDARDSVLLYNQYVRTPNEAKLKAAHKKLLAARSPPSVAKKYNHNYEGVCMAKFYPAKCRCGQPCVE